MQTPRPRTFGEAGSTEETESDDEFRSPRIPSPLAHVALVAFAVLAAAGTFVLPPLREAGLSFLHSFLAVAAIEMTAGVGAGYAAFNLYLDSGAE